MAIFFVESCLSDAAFCGLNIDSSTTRCNRATERWSSFQPWASTRYNLYTESGVQSFSLANGKQPKLTVQYQRWYFVHGPYFNYWVSWRIWCKFLMIVSSSFWLDRVMERRSTSNIYHRKCFVTGSGSGQPEIFVTHRWYLYTLLLSLIHLIHHHTINELAFHLSYQLQP